MVCLDHQQNSPYLLLVDQVQCTTLLITNTPTSSYTGVGFLPLCSPQYTIQWYKKLTCYYIVYIILCLIFHQEKKISVITFTEASCSKETES